jgi:hypothetical protein
VKQGYAERLNTVDHNLHKSKPSDDYGGSNNDLLYVPMMRSDFQSKPPQYANNSSYFPVNTNTRSNTGSGSHGSRAFSSSRGMGDGRGDEASDDSESVGDRDEDDNLTIDSLSTSIETINRLDNDDSSYQGCIELRGPYSPLEVAYHSISNIGFSKKARIERDSINYPAIDDDPTNGSTRLLVAADVSLNPDRTGMILRKTSLMPKLPGLAGLCCLLFAPTVEMRAEEKRRAYYTGVLCGLGFDNRTRLPIYADNDIECNFDVKIDTGDLRMVSDFFCLFS